MQNKHKTFFSFFGGPTYGGGGGGVCWLGQKPKFFRKSILMAPLKTFWIHYDIYIFKQVEDTIPMNHPWQMDNAARKMRLMGWDLRTSVVLHASKRNRISPRRKETAQEIHLNLTMLWLKSSSENATTKAKMMANWVNTRPYTWNCKKLICGCF